MTGRDLTPMQRAILQAAVAGSWHVRADTLLEIADLMQRGWIEAEDGEEMIHIAGTSEGIRQAEALGLIKRDPTGALFYATEECAPWR